MECAGPVALCIDRELIILNGSFNHTMPRAHLAD